MKTRELEPASRQGPSLVSVDGRTYPLESVHIKARSEGGIAASKLVQVFGNPHDEPLEVVYTLPLPADGAVLGYTIRMGEKVIHGEVEPRERAEAMYKEALYQGKTAGLLEQDRADTFHQRLGNLPPRTKAEIEIEVLQPLAFLPGAGETAKQWEYRFPTVVNVRYQGEPGRVPDADRLDVDRDIDGNIPTRVEFEMEIAGCGTPAPRVTSPGHDLKIEPAEGVLKASLAHGARLDRDLVVRWDACADAVGVRLALGGGLAGDDGYYGLLTLVPPQAPATALARDLTILIDASGSMGGEPIAAAKRVVIDLLRGLSPKDRFELLEFANTPRRLTSGMVQASPRAIEQAVKAVREIQAGGATEMIEALLEALRPLRKEAQRQVILVSDGQIGFEDKAIRTVFDDLPAGARLHCVGIGSAPNRTLTLGLARAGRGVELFAEKESEAGEAARRLGAATAQPVLTEIEVSGDAVRGVAPERARDVLAGQPLVMAVELKPDGGLLQVDGRLAGAADRWIWRIDVPAKGAGVAAPAQSAIATTPLPIGALYGREAIADLEGKIGGRDAMPVLDAIQRLGMRHRIASRRTSLVAIAEEPSVDPNAPRRRERLAVELPAGVSAEGVGLMGATMAFPTGLVGSTLFDRDELAAAPEMLARHVSMRQALSLPSLRGAFHSIDNVTVISVDKRILVVEFEVPIDGFQIPKGKVQILGEHGESDEASVIPRRSTRREPLARGLRVKLALELPRGKKWEDFHSFRLLWTDEIVLGAGRKPKAMFAMEVEIDATV